VNVVTKVLTEVKNVASQSHTQQLRDYAAFASANGLRFDLWVRSTTTLSGPLLDAIEAQTINRRYIP
jgi:Restriction endonuclease fold toxin 7